MSAGMIWSVGLALVIDTVDSKHTGEAMGWISTGLSLGLLIAPSVGGIVYGKSGYYPVFFTCFGLIAIDIVFRISVVEVKDARKWALQAGDADDVYVDERNRLLGNGANNTGISFSFSHTILKPTALSNFNTSRSICSRCFGLRPARARAEQSRRSRSNGIDTSPMQVTSPSSSMGNRRRI